MNEWALGTKTLIEWALGMKTLIGEVLVHSETTREEKSHKFPATFYKFREIIKILF